MEPGNISTQVRRLQEALKPLGVEAPSPLVLEQIVTGWNREVGSAASPPGGQQPLRDGGWGAEQALAALDSALHGSGVQLGSQALPRLLWALLGVPAAGHLHLGSTRWSRLTHLTEFHDVSLPSSARSLGRQFAHEPHLAADLLRVRPWLDQVELPRAEGVLAAIFQVEWTGFLALLGEFGPWVYAPSVADLQALSQIYARLVHLAAESPEPEVLGAAFRLSRTGKDLLFRLEATDYRRPGEDPTAATTGSQASQASSHLVEAERAFWDTAEAQARQRYTAWAARRGGRR